MTTPPAPHRKLNLARTSLGAVLITSTLFALQACGAIITHETPSGGESHFLDVCTTTCGSSDLQCISGICTRSCIVGESSCSSLPGAAVCTADSVEPGVVAVCDVPCSATANCNDVGPFAVCNAGYCRNPASNSAGSGNTGSTATYASDAGMGVDPTYSYEVDAGPDYQMNDAAPYPSSSSGTVGIDAGYSPWFMLDVEGPDARYGAAIAYDSDREVVVMYKGWPIEDSNVWEWNGTSWSIAPSSNEGPAAMLGLGMAYDSQRGRIVTHGSDNSADGCPMVDGAGRATWQWDAGTWQLISCDGPPTYLGDLVYDSRRDRMIAIERTSPNSITWEFDGTNWAQADASLTSSLMDEISLAYDSDRGVTVLLEEEWIWEWDGSTWDYRGADGPHPGEGVDRSLAYDPNRQRTVARTYDSTWEWDGASWEAIELGGGPYVQFAQPVFNEARGSLVFFGGELGYLSGIPQADTWVYQP